VRQETGERRKFTFTLCDKTVAAARLNTRIQAEQNVLSFVFAVYIQNSINSPACGRI
jgi:hypothetical protein